MYRSNSTRSFNESSDPKMKKVILTFFLLSSCATSIQEEDCNKNMRDVGFQDASKGLSSSMFKTYQSYCDWKDVNQQKASYLQGYNEGLNGYCTKRQGNLVGESGRPFPNQCKGRQEFSFGYAEGKKKALQKRAKK